MMELLSKYVEFKNGKKRPTSKGIIPVYGGNGILDYTNTANMQSGVVIGRVGVYCGSVFLVREECWVSDNAIKAMCKENMDLGYLYYLLSSLHLNERRIGTSQPLLTQNILNNIEVEVPELAIQKKISSTLELLDEKIKLNNEINNNLPPHLCVARIAATQLRQTPKMNGCLHTDDKVSDRGGNSKIPQVFSSRRAA